ncbi:hypothetical protein SUGI_1204030 [Cryptomeria japonica]|nr:hypothetical protein SUGI_1204030 [Cryptomeria japonica]
MCSSLLACFSPSKRYADDSEGVDSVALATPPKKEKEEQEQEHTEEFEYGIYITVIRLVGGLQQVKRIKFSREQFSEMEAKLWWEENQCRVHQYYA